MARKQKITEKVDWALVRFYAWIRGLKTSLALYLKFKAGAQNPAYARLAKGLKLPSIPKLGVSALLKKYAKGIRFLLLFALLAFATGFGGDKAADLADARGGNVLFDAMILGFGAWCIGLIWDAIKASFKT